MAFSLAALRERFARKKVKDPFGEDNLFAIGSRFAGKGPKIALAASGMLFVVLVGGIAAIVVTGDAAPPGPPVAGSLANLVVVDDDADEPAAPTAAAPVAAAPKPATVPDATAATDRSLDRRPWLASPTPAPEAPRPGMAGNTAKTTPPVTPPPPAKVAAAPAQVKPAAVKPAEVKTALTPPAPATAPKPVLLPGAAATPGATPTIMPPAAPTPVEAADVLDPNRDIAGIPALQTAGTAPGAPRIFNQAGDSGPTVAGGRPRLVEPPLPPTDKITISAPPPRYANLTDIKRDAAAAAAPPANASKVAFIVHGLGLSQAATDAAINKLPPAVTLAFSPYTRDLKKWLGYARDKGHEVLIDVPMESKQFPSDDPGPLGLLTAVDAKENQVRLETILKESGGAIGIYDAMGSKFRESGPHIEPVFAKLKEANLFYVQGSPGIRVGEATVPTAVADVIIDERPFRAAIDARLDFAERLAKYQGSAVVALSAKPVSFERLVLWLEQAQKKGVVLAPISQVLIK